MSSKIEFKRIVILPGNGGGDVFSCNWYASLQSILKEKLPDTIEVVLQNMPEPVIGPMKRWIPFMHDELNCDENTLVIGHSTGAVAIMRYLENFTLGGAILVGAYTSHLGDAGEKKSGYFDDEWNWSLQQKNCRTIPHVFGSTDDPFLPEEEQDTVAKQLNATYHKYTDKGHFMTFQPDADLIAAVLSIIT